MNSLEFKIQYKPKWAGGMIILVPKLDQITSCTKISVAFITIRIKSKLLHDHTTSGSSYLSNSISYQSPVYS